MVVEYDYQPAERADAETGYPGCEASVSIQRVYSATDHKKTCFLEFFSGSAEGELEGKILEAIQD
jgi:hypothetical protein